LITASLGFQVVIASLLALAIYLAVDNLALFVVKDATSFSDDAREAIYYSALNIVILMYRNVYISLFMGLQRYGVSSVYESLYQITASLASLAFLWLGHGITGMIVARLMLNLASLPVLHFIAKRLVPSFRLAFDISRELLREIYDFASWLVAGRINRLALNALPPILINTYIGPSGIAYFNIASRIVSALNNLLASATTVIFPFVSELKALEEPGRIRSLYLGANRVLSLISAPLYAFGAIYSWDILYVWLGTDIANNCSMLMTLFFVGYYLSSATMVPSSFALGMGKTKILAVTGFAQTILMLLFLPSFINAFGILGMGFNLVMFEAASVVMVVVITTRIIGASSFVFWVRDRLLILSITTLIFLVFTPLKDNLWEASWSRMGTSAYLACVFLIGLSLYGLLILQSRLVDQATKDRLLKLFQENKQ
jgi:O-antigen/teichoic acid export membrane protein